MYRLHGRLHRLDRGLILLHRRTVLLHRGLIVLRRRLVMGCRRLILLHRGLIGLVILLLGRIAAGLTPLGLLGRIHAQVLIARGKHQIRRNNAHKNT